MEKDAPRSKQVAWIRAILSHTGWSQTDLARRAGLNPSTLSRFLREVNPGSNLNQNSIAAIERVGGIPAFSTEPPAVPRGFAEQEATPFRYSEADPLSAVVDTCRRGRNAVDAWVLASRALETAGYMPGDILLVDLNGVPQSGDVVCVQLYDRAGRAETAFRIYEHPYLVAASLDPQLRRPVLLDGERAIVRGVVIASLRQRGSQQHSPEAA